MGAALRPRARLVAAACLVLAASVGAQQRLLDLPFQVRGQRLLMVLPSLLHRLPGSVCTLEHDTEMSDARLSVCPNRL